MPVLNFWERFGAIFKPNLIERLQQEKSGSGSWAFWFASNLFLILIIMTLTVAYVRPHWEDFPGNLLKEIPAEALIVDEDGVPIDLGNVVQNFEVVIKDGELTLNNIPDPAVILLGEDQAMLVDPTKEIPADTSAVIIDTKEEIFSSEVATDFEEGLFVFRDEFIIRDKKKAETKTIYFSDFPEDITFNYDVIQTFIKEVKPKLSRFLVIFGFIAGYFFLSIFRLVFAVFWGLIFWVIGLMIGLKKWHLETSFFAALHFMFFIFIVNYSSILMGIDFTLKVPILFTLFFTANLWHLKQVQKK